MKTIAVDTSVFLLLIDDSAPIPDDPGTKKPVPRSGERVRRRTDMIGEDGAEILISTPVAAESLIRQPGSVHAGLIALRGYKGIRVAAFDEDSAIELAEVSKSTPRRRKKTDSDPSHQKVKFDRQIVATAKAHGADAIYTMDSDVRKAAAEFELAFFGIADMPEPPPTQELLDFVPATAVNPFG